METFSHFAATSAKLTEYVLEFLLAVLIHAAPYALSSTGRIVRSPPGKNSWPLNSLYWDMEFLWHVFTLSISQLVCSVMISTKCQIPFWHATVGSVICIWAAILTLSFVFLAVYCLFCCLAGCDVAAGYRGTAARKKAWTARVRQRAGSIGDAERRKYSSDCEVRSSDENDSDFAHFGGGWIAATSSDVQEVDEDACEKA